jgi:single-strand DNA-binding protein
MYRDLNIVAFGGRLAADPEQKTINGNDCVKFRIVVNNGVEDGPNNNTLYIDAEWWNPNKGAQYLEKGKKVEITGRMMMSHWIDKNDNSKRSRPFVKIISLELRGSSKKTESEEVGSDFISSLVSE